MYKSGDVTPQIPIKQEMGGGIILNLDPGRGAFDPLLRHRPSGVSLFRSKVASARDARPRTPNALDARTASTRDAQNRRSRTRGTSEWGVAPLRQDPPKTPRLDTPDLHAYRPCVQPLLFLF
ncbi:unnamed protein product [Leptidea sinapis]|uniref:Uncharacterized protein n=1 Tax=Leptidea sinapis TaxID=189913 RepID=A0A5E4QFC6_9NEOP|nr:unnamed protein product [Leptidea sinapis]